jgi:hypothetical protein
LIIIARWLYTRSWLANSPPGGLVPRSPESTMNHGSWEGDALQTARKVLDPVRRRREKPGRRRKITAGGKCSSMPAWCSPSLIPHTDQCPCKWPPSLLSPFRVSVRRGRAGGSLIVNAMVAICGPWARVNGEAEQGAGERGG